MTFTDVLPDISITKTADPTIVPESGAWVTFTFVITNNGDEEVTLSKLEDDVFGDISDECELPKVIPGHDSYTCSISRWIEGDWPNSHKNVTTATAYDDEENEDTASDEETVDFVEPGSITGYKYEDLDADGVKDDGEPGFEGVTINLLRQDGDGNVEIAGEQGNIVDTTKTDEDGRFHFDGVEPGIYDIEEVLDSGVFTKTPTMMRDVEVISGEETVLEDCFLNYMLGSITGYKYNDVNANGAYDPGIDTPWDGTARPITIALYRDSVQVSTDVIDAADGKYQFKLLIPDDYELREIIPEGSDVASVAETTIKVTVKSGEDLVVGKPFLNYIVVVAGEVVTPPVTPAVQTQVLPATGWNLLPLLLAAGLLMLLGLAALALGMVLRVRS